MKIPLTNVCDFQGGSQPPKEEWIDHEASGYVRMLQIRDFTQAGKNNIEYVKDGKNLKKCTSDDILIGRYGASVGKVLSGLSGAYNVAIIKAIPNDARLTKRYLYYYLNSDYFQNYILSVGSRAAQAGFNKDDLEGAIIPLFDIPKQIDIVALLDMISNLISLRKQQLAKLDELVKARFVELFGDPVTNPMEWELHRFDSLCENLDYRRQPITASEREAGIYPYYGASGVVDYVADYLFDEDILLISEDGANLLMRSTPIAFSVSGKVWVNNHAHVVKFEKMSMQKYIEVFFSLIDVSDHITGSAQPKLNQAKLNAMMFPVPSDERLDAFLQFVEQTDKSKLTVQQSLDKLELLKKALMQKYFG